MERSGRFQGQFDFQNLGVGVGVARLGVSTNVGCRVVDPRLAAFSFDKAFVKGIREGRVLTPHLGDVEKALLAKDLVSSLLAISSDITALALVAGKTLVTPFAWT